MHHPGGDTLNADDLKMTTEKKPRTRKKSRTAKSAIRKQAASAKPAGAVKSAPEPALSQGEIDQTVQAARPNNAEVQGERLLSQDEIDTLLSAIDGEDSGKEADRIEAQEGDIRPYDFTRQHQKNMHLPGLELLNERFARRFRIGLLSLLHCAVEIKPTPLRPQTFTQFMNQLPMPTCLNIVNVRPLYGSAMFVFDTQLVYALVDIYFGGSGRASIKTEGRDFTPTEIRVVRAILRQAFTDLSAVWDPISPLRFQYDRFEQNPRFATILGPDELVLESGFTLDVGGSNGAFRILFPLSMLEPVQKLLATTYQEATPEQANETSIHFSSLEGIDTEAVCEFGTLSLTVGQLLSLKPGAIIPLEPMSQPRLKVSGLVIAQGQAGMKDGNLGFRVESMQSIEPEPRAPS